MAETENDRSQEEAIQRIKKLLQHAKGSGHHSDGEIDNALKLARKLMQKYNIEESSVLIDDEAARQSAYDSIRTESGYERAHAIDPFDVRLAWVPSLICDVQFYTQFKMGKNKKGRLVQMQHIMFYGLPKDIAIAKALYHELLATMRAMIRFRYPEDWQPKFSSYCHGFVDRLVGRAQDLKKTPPAAEGSASACTAIVLVKDALVEKWAEANLSLRSKKSRERRVGDDDAYLSGSEDGANVDLGTRGISQGPLGEGRRLR